MAANIATSSIKTSTKMWSFQNHHTKRSRVSHPNSCRSSAYKSSTVTNRTGTITSLRKEGNQSIRLAKDRSKGSWKKESKSETGCCSKAMTWVTTINLDGRLIGLHLISNQMDLYRWWTFMSLKGNFQTRWWIKKFTVSRSSYKGVAGTRSSQRSMINSLKNQLSAKRLLKMLPQIK